MSLLSKYTQSGNRVQWSMGRIPRVADSGVTPPPLPPPLPPRPTYMPSPGPGNAPRPPKQSEMNSCLIMAMVIPLVILVGAGIVGALMLPMLARSREAVRRSTCQNNLKQIGLVCKMYANENQEQAWPRSFWGPARPVLHPDPIYPEYLTDPFVVHCPSDAETLDPEATPQDQIRASSYVYFGYALTNEDEMLAFIEAYPSFVEEGVDATQDLPAPKGRGSFGGDTFVRLRDDLQNPRGIPVMFDAAADFGDSIEFMHIPGGANVLYLDGHVEFVKFPGKPPMTRKILEALGKLKEAERASIPGRRIP